MMRFIKKLVFLFTLIGSAKAELPQEHLSLSDLDQYIQNTMQDWKIPGLAIAIAKDNKIIFIKGYGVLKVGNPNKINENTIFAIGSCTKSFTATALGILVDEGKISWDDKVQHHLANFQVADPYITKELTIRDILSHRSGLDPSDTLWSIMNLDSKAILQRLCYIKTIAPLRSSWIYNNIFYLVAGEIITAASKTSWHDFIKTRLFMPLGMINSFTCSKEIQNLNNIASCHFYDDAKEEIVAIPWKNIDNIAPAGAIASSIADMAKWLLFNLDCNNEKLLSFSSHQELYSPQIARPETPMLPSKINFYGLGWSLQEYKGLKLISHNGGFYGTTSRIAMLPEKHLGVVVLTNMQGSLITHDLILHIFDEYLGGEKTNWHKNLLEYAQKLKDKAQKEAKMMQEQQDFLTTTFDDFLGCYHNDLYGDLVITQNHEKLHFTFYSLTDDLTHLQNDSFLFVPTKECFYISQTVLNFIKNKNGKIDAVIVKGFVNETFHKLSFKND